MKPVRISRASRPGLITLMVAALLGTSCLAHAREGRSQNEEPGALPSQQTPPAKQAGESAAPPQALQAQGSYERRFRNGDTIRYWSNRKVSDYHDAGRGVDIHLGLNGSRTVIASRPDHSLVVYLQGRPGYVGQPYSFHGQNFERRTYAYHGQTCDYLYHVFPFRGLNLDVYAPAQYWNRGYYGWAYHPWTTPVHYRWGWMESPWRRYFSFYFNPYAVYPSAAFWLTDYILSQDLEDAYAAQQETGEVNGDLSKGMAPVSPDVKQMIADEVKNQLALENQEAQQNAMGQDIDPASSGMGRILSDVLKGRTHAFVVDAPLDVVDASGIVCTLSDGDVLSLRQEPPEEVATADLAVMASKGGLECPGNDVVSVRLDDLQEMQNGMRQAIDRGLQKLNQDQGQDGLPPAPPATTAPAQYAAAAPPPDPNAASQLLQTAKLTTLAENEMNAAAQKIRSRSATPPPIRIGQTVEEVESILGPPTGSTAIGNKLIYDYNNYNGMYILFVNGRVTEVR